VDQRRAACIAAIEQVLDRMLQRAGVWSATGADILAA
jgi:hypothetical protein